MHSKPLLQISTGYENTPEENQLIVDAFKDNFNIKVENNYFRCSYSDLPFIIFIGLATNGIYDLLKVEIKKVLENISRKRGGSVVIRKENEQYVFSKDYFVIRKNIETIEFSSVDDLFEYLKNRDQNTPESK